MIEVTIRGNDYKIEKLCADDAHDLHLDLSPLLPALVPLFQSISKGELAKAMSGDDALPIALAAEPLANILSSMDKAKRREIRNICMSVVKIKQGKTYSPLYSDGICMFDHIESIDLFHLQIYVIKNSLGGFIQGLNTQGMEENAAQ